MPNKILIVKQNRHYLSIFKGETFEKRPLSPPAYFGGTLHSDFNPRNIGYIPMVNPAKAGLIRLDLERN